MTNTDETEFAQRHPKDGEKYTDMIAWVRPDWKVTSFSVKDGVFPKDISRFDGIMITGSPASVLDDAPWISKLLDLIRSAHTQDVPMFGACFGHQAIGLALGGRVEKNPMGWAFGALEMDVVAKPPWFNGPESFVQYGAHIEQITQLPPSAEVVFKTSGCDAAGFIIGSRIYTTQNHPEMTPEFIEALIEELSGKMDLEVTDRARISLKRKADSMMFAETIAVFFEQAVS
jgi:GMP synthase-like glutamine amidotransferase